MVAMKKIGMLFLGALLICSMGSMCETPSSGGGGGGLFSTGETSSDTQQWDLLLLLEEGLCEDGLAGSGASDPDVPAIYFPGISVDASEFELSGEVPEVHMLGYYIIPPEMIPSAAFELGSPVRVEFEYLADAEAGGVNYFLVRLIDGDRFLVPLRVSGRDITSGGPQKVSFSYTPEAPQDFGLQFISGLSSASDSVYIDNLEVWSGDNLLFADDFEAGDYSVITPVLPNLFRIPFYPSTPAGSAGLQSGTTLEGAQTFQFQGGRTFQLYGQGTETDEFSGFMVNYVRSGISTSFYGESMFLDQGKVLMGDYYGVDNVTTQNCSESGYALATINPKGNVDLSGNWTLSVQAMCEEDGLGIADPATGGMATYSAAPFYVTRYLMVHQGAGFNSAFGDSISSVMGLTSGTAGMFMLSWGTGNAAQLMGSYDKDSGILSGQIQGSLPVGGQTCTITEGMFSVMVDPSGMPPAR